MQENEITRAIKLNGKTAEFVSFKLPKRYGNMGDLEVFQNQEITYDEWENSIVKDHVYKDYTKQRELLESRYNQNASEQHLPQRGRIYERDPLGKFMETNKSHQVIPKVSVVSQGPAKRPFSPQNYRK